MIWEPSTSCRQRSLVEGVDGAGPSAFEWKTFLRLVLRIGKLEHLSRRFRAVSDLTRSVNASVIVLLGCFQSAEWSTRDLSARKAGSPSLGPPRILGFWHVGAPRLRAPLPPQVDELM